MYNITIIISIAATIICIFYFFKNKIVYIANKALQKINTKYTNAIIQSKIIEQSIHILPLLLCMYFVAFVPKSLQEPAYKIINTLFIIAIFVVVFRLIDVFHIIYKAKKGSSRYSIKGYLQLLKLVLFLVLSILALSSFIGISPWGLLSTLGAMTAIITFIFKDTILSVIANIQVISNNLIKVGDWIQMPSFNADGDVIDISLHILKVQNFDKTIVSIPLHKLLENSFINWRGMSESGGRRIKRSILIDINSIKFADKSLLSKFKKINALKEYIESKIKDIGVKEGKKNDLFSINKRGITNIGTFRAYIAAYLKNNKNIDDKNKTFLIRQLSPTKDGLPLEIYVFANTTNWVEYEDIQSDIFDHIFAILKDFELRAVQIPTSQDIKEALLNNNIK